MTESTHQTLLARMPKPETLKEIAANHRKAILDYKLAGGLLGVVLSSGMDGLISCHFCADPNDSKDELQILEELGYSVKQFKDSEGTDMIEISWDSIDNVEKYFGGTK